MFYNLILFTKCKEAFKRSVEVDANRRAEERRQKKEVAERFKMEGNKAFRAGNYNKALDSYNKVHNCFIK